MGDAPLSRPAFYRYFTDMHDLVESMLSEFEVIIHQTTNPWIKGEGDPIAAIRKSLKGVVQARRPWARFSSDLGSSTT